MPERFVCVLINGPGASHNLAQQFQGVHVNLPEPTPLGSILFYHQEDFPDLLLVGTATKSASGFLAGLPLYVTYEANSMPSEPSRVLTLRVFSDPILRPKGFAEDCRMAPLVHAKMLGLGILPSPDTEPTLKDFGKLLDWWLANNRPDLGASWAVPETVEDSLGEELSRVGGLSDWLLANDEPDLGASWAVPETVEDSLG
ncbi:MAG: hypothetical protein Q9184_001332 [Pyrenodesmia sp. 2 TL-2023]